MEDLNQQISQILSDPQSMQQLQSMAAALGLGGGTPSPAPEPPPAQTPPSPSGLNGGAVPAASVSNPLGGLGGITPEALQLVTRIAPLLGQVNQEDDATRLLRALRPLLSAARQKKLDEAIKILQMMRLLPLLRESGLFSGLLSGLL